LAKPFYDSIGPSSHPFYRFAPRATIAEQLPPRTLRADFRRCTALVVTIVPFHQIRIDYRDIAETGQFTGPASAQQGTDENSLEREVFEPIGEVSSHGFSVFSQRKISQSSVLSG
jgi:hypothetical protein